MIEGVETRHDPKLDSWFWRCPPQGFHAWSVWGYRTKIMAESAADRIITTEMMR